MVKTADSKRDGPKWPLIARKSLDWVCFMKGNSRQKPVARKVACGLFRLGNWVVD